VRKEKGASSKGADFTTHFSVNLSAGDLVFTNRFGKINLITDELVTQQVDMGRYGTKEFCCDLCW
jgi:hypothetical protein